MDSAVTVLSQIANSNQVTEVKKAVAHALGNSDSPAARAALIELIENQ